MKIDSNYLSKREPSEWKNATKQTAVPVKCKWVPILDSGTTGESTIWNLIHLFHQWNHCIIILYSYTSHSHKHDIIIRKIKVKGPDIYIPPLTRKPELHRFTTRSGVLTSISSRRCSTVSGCPLHEWTDFGPTVAVRRTHLCPSQLHYGLHAAMFSSNDSLF